MNHPKVAFRSCVNCQKWLYDEKTGKVVLRGGKPQKRTGATPPCESCPKKSPELASEYELSDKNHKAVQLYHRVQAMNARCLNDREARDPILSRNLGLIHQILTNHEKASLVTAITATMAIKGI